MLKKTLYPFTDWNWLKLPLGSLVIGALMMMVTLAMLGSVAYHQAHTEAAMSSMAVAYMALYLMFGLLYCAYAGYLFRVARQPQAEEPLKLPSWSKPGSLIKDGFQGTFAYMMLVYALGFLLAFFGGSMGAVIHSLGLWDWVTSGGLVSILAACGVVFLFIAAIVGIYVWFGVFAPILLVRYAYTGRMRHVFSPRWAWRAVAIAPLEYLVRSSAWTLSLVAITVLTPLTAGVAYFLGMLLMPLAMINVAYLLGDYYSTYLDD